MWRPKTSPLLKAEVRLRSIIVRHASVDSSRNGEVAPPGPPALATSTSMPPPTPLQGLFENGFHILQLRDVAREGGGTPHSCPPLDIVGRGGDAVFVDVYADDTGSLGCQAKGESPSDAASRSRVHRCATRQSPRLVRHRLPGVSVMLSSLRGVSSVRGSLRQLRKRDVLHVRSAAIHPSTPFSIGTLSDSPPPHRLSGGYPVSFLAVGRMTGNRTRAGCSGPR